MIEQNDQQFLESVKDCFVEGESRRRNGEYEQAVAEFTQAIQLSNEAASGKRTQAILAEAYMLRGAAAGLNGDLDASINDFSEAIRLNPSWYISYFNRGVSWQFKGASQEAIADYSQCIQLKPNYWDAYLRRGVVWRSLNEHQKARADFATVRKCNEKARAKGSEWRIGGRRSESTPEQIANWFMSLGENKL